MLEAWRIKQLLLTSSAHSVLPRVFLGLIFSGGPLFACLPIELAAQSRCVWTDACGRPRWRSFVQSMPECTVLQSQITMGGECR